MSPSLSQFPKQIALPVDKQEPTILPPIEKAGLA